MKSEHKFRIGEFVLDPMHRESVVVAVIIKRLGVRYTVEYPDHNREDWDETFLHSSRSMRNEVSDESN